MKENHLSISLLPNVQLESLIAGICGGVSSTLLLHPLDLMKVRYAVSDVKREQTTLDHQRPEYKSLRQAFREVYRSEGIPGLYRGVVPNVWGAGSAWGLYFLFYQNIKSYLQAGNSSKNLGAPTHLATAAASGVFTLMLTNPIWVVKTRLCLQFPSSTGVSSTSESYKGMLDALIKIYRYEGVRGFYKGFVAGVLGVSHGAIQFMVYEELKTRYNNYKSSPIDTRLSSAEYLSFAALSKLVAAVITYPYQVIRARMQDQRSYYKGLLHCVQEVYRKNGLIAFYHGLRPYCVRVVPATALTFVVYEKVMVLLTPPR